MIDLDSTNITEAFAALAAQPKDPRTRDILVSLASHLHQWVCEVGLTHEEWRAGLMAVTRAAAITDESRNEFSLFSDMMGVTSLVDLINTPEGATSSSPLGPFHQRGAPPMPNGGDLWKGQEGEVVVVCGRVIDGITGKGIGGATLDMWQNADNGFYAVQDAAQPPLNYHGFLTCDEEGGFAFTTTLFRPYTVPYDGPVGEMLRALGRDAWRPAHLHVIAEAEEYRALVTELFVSGDPWLEKDAAFGVRRDLVLALDDSSDLAAVPEILIARDRLPDQFLRADVEIRMGKAAA